MKKNVDEECSAVAELDSTWKNIIGRAYQNNSQSFYRILLLFIFFLSLSTLLFPLIVE